MIVQRAFAKEPASVPAARRLVKETMTGLPADLVERALLMVSELATNALKHASSAFTVTVDFTPARLKVEVADFGSGQPAVRHPSPSEPTGRGLQIVGALSTDWGVENSRAGKVVWFTLPVEGGHGPVSGPGTAARQISSA